MFDVYRRPRPSPEWRQSALVIMDVTGAFLGPREPPLVAARRVRTACGLAGWNVLPNIVRLLDSFRAARHPIVFALPVWSSEAAYGGATAGYPMAVADDGLAPGLEPGEGELLLEKTKASAFFGTPLASFLIRNGIASIVLAGCTTSGCVRASAVDGASLGFGIVVVHDACFDRVHTSHLVALQELDVKYATIVSTDAAMDSISQAHR